MRPLVLLLALALAGCIDPAIIRALAKDPASACITVTTIYGTLKVYRTGMPVGTLNCSQDGMTVTSGPPR